MFSRILIANRGEIACRVIRTAKRMGIETVAVYSDADRDALHVRQADRAVALGGASAAETYLDAKKIIAAAKETGAQAIHPGYGFLSENASFARACAEAGIVFIGPPPEAIEAMGDKIASKKRAVEAGVTTVPGHPEPVEDGAEALKIAETIGYPVMIKASAGGGGKGMRIAHSDADMAEGLERARSEALASFGDDRVLIEKFITDPRHIEIQVMADAHGTVIHLGERECSIQRRHQKVIEEAPSPLLDPETREAMGAQAVALARAVGYQSAGTVEFIADADKNFYFLEMNTRLQVEHPVTELVTGIDLVELMLRVAAGEKLPLAQAEVKHTGWAIESRIYAEDPYRQFLPSTGRLIRFRRPADAAGGHAHVRVDTGVGEGGEISRLYDPMIAKLATWGPTRAAAVAAMQTALDGFEIEGIGHNLRFLSAVMAQERFRAGRLTTGYIAEEFPEGFSGVVPDAETLDRLAALACCAALRLETRGFAGAPAREGPLEATRAVIIGNDRWDLSAHAAGDFFSLTRPDGPVLEVETGWRPGDTLAEARIDGHQMIVALTRRTSGFRIRYRGADLNARVLQPRVADLTAHMPVKPPPDLSRFLLCPMPGQVVRLEVGAGEIVEGGQPLAIVEAMKMENVLRAEKRAKVARLNVAVGDVLAVDEVIMEFEEA
ncbi:MAG TPA: acetyl/propionyl/methylcrotonyl-CoA carboxylase subunit alpha [Devosiaceae bacterium]|nr:acetyl/propionyl/methylcrotonyl-CoA carboxylase subunit alpha [Devosiaceae bacterium]